MNFTLYRERKRKSEIERERERERVRIMRFKELEFGQRPMRLDLIAIIYGFRAYFGLISVNFSAARTREKPNKRLSTTLTKPTYSEGNIYQAFVEVWIGNGKAFRTSFASVVCLSASLSRAPLFAAE